MKKIVLGMILVGILFLVGCQINPEQKECPECEEVQILKDKAMLSTDMYTWGINELDESEILFDYWLKNFGDSEAKDIKVRCNLVDEARNVAVNVVDNYGNLASKSIELGEVLTKKTSKYDRDIPYSGFCYVESCINCEILYKRIPDLVKSYEIK